jgi:hypothetical protein
VSLAPHPARIQYPAQAAFGRVVPKNKIYESAGASARLKELFVRHVEQIVWCYKLAPETINLPAKPGVPEIQIFGIQLKTPELPVDVLRCMDSAVQFPIVFELTHGSDANARAQVAAAYKRPNAVDTSQWVLSEYFFTDWFAASQPRAAMPMALDLAGLYEQMLHCLAAQPVRPREPLAEWVGRIEQIAAKRREVAKVEAQLRKEKQFNRKVEINARLRQLSTELQELS